MHLDMKLHFGRLYSHRILTALFCFLLSFLNSVAVYAADDARIIFLHHSVGSNVYYQGGVASWITDYNAAHGTAYQISERAYPSTPYPWNNYPYDYWNLWVNQACDSNDPDIECMNTLTQNYDVIIFKHCFPGADVLADTGNPDISSSRRSLENYKLQYRELRDLMDGYPNNQFIVWTLTPEHRLSTNTDNAGRARLFVDWVKNSWLNEDGLSHDNIHVFDFWGYVAESDSNPANGQVNTLRYEYEGSHSSGDSHPNQLANQTIGPLFAQFIVNTIADQPQPQTGSLHVTIAPSGAVSAGAQWNVDGSSWHNSADTQTDLSVGSHTVSFKDVSGWTRPADQTVAISSGQTTSASGTYTQAGPYHLNLAVNGQGVVELDPSGGTYDEGTSVTLTAIAATDYQFDHWEGDVSGSPNPLTVTFNSDMNVTAVFTAIVIPPGQHAITTAIQGNGNIALNPAGGIYDEGTSVTLTATAGNDYQFDHWKGDVSGSTNPLSVTVNSDMNVTAVFAAQEGVTSTFTTSDGQIITVRVSAGTLTLQETGETVPDNLDFIYSPMDIEINNIPVGVTVEVTIDLPAAAPNDASIYKFIDGSWLNSDSNLQVNAQRTSVTFPITDGERGDNDNVADGHVLASIGLATAADNSSHNSSGDGGGQGCFIESIFNCGSL